MARFLAPHRAKTAAIRLANKLRGRPTIHLLHIGKTGGTAVKHTLAQLPSNRTPLVVHPHEIALSDVPPGDGVVFFVRDPIDRFLSGFYSRKRRGLPAHNKDWDKGEHKAFQRFATPDMLGGFLESEDADERHAAVEAMHAIEHVRSSYWDWFGNEKALQQRIDDIAFIGQQEALATDFERLKLLLDWPMELILPASPELAHVPAVQEDRTLSQVARANLARWYRREYDFLDCCDYWRKRSFGQPFDHHYHHASGARGPAS